MTDQRARWGRGIGEAILIMASILVALGVDAWWDGKQEAERRHELLLALRADFAATAEHLGDRLGRAEELVDIANAFIAVSDSPEPIPADSIRQLQVFNTVRIAPQIGSYRAAMNSGELRLVRSRRLNMLLNEFEDGLGWWRTVYDTNADMALNGRLSVVMSDYGGLDRFWALADLHDAVRRPAVRSVASDFSLAYLNFRSSITSLQESTLGILEELDRLIEAD